MTTVLNSTTRLKDFLVSEANFYRSRQKINVTQTGTRIESGTLLAKVGEKYVPYTNQTGTTLAILYEALPAKTGDTLAVGFVRDCEVSRAQLTGLTTAGEALLGGQGVVVRGIYTTP